MKFQPVRARIVFIGVACLMLTIACSMSSAQGTGDTPTSAPSATAVVLEPTSTSTPRPTNTPRPTSTTGPTKTPEPPSCYKWDQITIDMAGQEVCVFGIAYSHQGRSRVDFSPEKNTFFLIDTVYYYPNLDKGSCIVAYQKVEVFDGKIPFMTINGDLFICEPWMEEEAAK